MTTLVVGVSSSSGLEHAWWNMAQMASRGWWMVAIRVMPPPARRAMCSMMFKAAKASSPASPSQVKGTM